MLARDFTGILHMGDVGYNLDTNNGKIGDEYLRIYMLVGHEYLRLLVGRRCRASERMDDWEEVYRLRQIVYYKCRASGVRDESSRNRRPLESGHVVQEATAIVI